MSKPSLNFLASRRRGHPDATPASSPAYPQADFLFRKRNVLAVELRRTCYDLHVDLPGRRRAYCDRREDLTRSKRGPRGPYPPSSEAEADRVPEPRPSNLLAPRECLWRIPYGPW